MRKAHSWLLVAALLAPSPVLAGASGSLDPFFGVGGRDVYRSSKYYTNPKATSDLVLAPDDSPLVLDGKNLLLPDGKLASILSITAGKLVFCRRSIDGTYDPTFGGNGTGCVQQPADTGTGYALARQSDGKLLVAGGTDYPLHRLYVARFDADGIVDPSFGTGGVVLVDFGAGLTSKARAVLVQPDGRIVVGGSVEDGPYSYYTQRAFALARLDANGALDASFGTGGLVTSSFGVLPEVRDLALQADGRIVAVGDDRTDDSSCHYGVPTFIARYADDGTLDPTFGAGGVISDVFDPLGGGCGPNAVLVQPDGKILVGGAARVREPLLAEQPAVARYLADGTRDTTFGHGGIAWTATTPGFTLGGINAFARQADGGIVATGRNHTVSIRWFGGTCGDGVLEAGEDCDDGNLVPADGCDANCCTSDADGDGLCDAIDACTGGESITGMTLSLARFGFGGDEFKPPADRFLLKGKVTASPALLAAVDPSTNGLHLLLDDSTGTILDLAVAGGAYDDRRFGWKTRGAAHVYVDKHRFPGSTGKKGGLAPYQISKIKVVPIPDRSMMRVTVRGRRTRYYEILPYEPQLAMTLVFDTASGACVTETLTCVTEPAGAECF